MLLLIDIGNTQITIGFYYKGEVGKVLRINTLIGGRSREEYSYILTGFINKQHIEVPEGAVICSVVPEVTPLLAAALKESFNIDPLHVTHTIKTGLRFLIENIEGLGADRIANAVAAHKLYKGNLIIIDFGTATTFCALTENGEYIGGAIMPGITLSAQALSEKTSKLPLIELKAPEAVLGKNTAENIRSGVIIGHAGAVEGIIGRIKAETGKDYTVIATGGFAGFMKPYLKVIDHVNPLLTLEGLRFIHEMNSNL